MSAVLVMRCTASAATSAGPTTRPMGSVATKLGPAGLELVAEERRRQGRVDEAGGDEVRPDRRQLERQVRDQRREGRGHRRDEREADAGLAAAGAADEQQRAGRPHPGCAVAGDGERHQQVLVDVAAAPRRSPCRPGTSSRDRSR